MLKRIEILGDKLGTMAKKAVKDEQRERAFYAQKFINALGMTIARKEPVFGIEPWHALQENLSFSRGGEFLLRLKDYNGLGLSPYPAVMMLYHNGFTEEFDTILTLTALEQFKSGPDKQVTINISCRSLQNEEFVRATLKAIEALDLKPLERIIFEIHESNAVISINDKTAKLYKKFGVGFAIDDVGLSMNDVFRLSAFENIADFIKLDRQTVNGHPDDPKAFAHILSLTHSLLPRAQMVAEGIASAEHAQEIASTHPNLRYVQGLYLPDRATFAKQWREVKSVG